MSLKDANRSTTERIMVGSIVEGLTADKHTYPDKPSRQPKFLDQLYQQSIPITSNHHHTLSYLPSCLPHHNHPLPQLQTVNMRPLTEQETQTLFAKLANYTGASLKNLIAPLDDSPNADRYVFRLVRDRVYYVRLSIANMASSVARDNLLALGTCLGKFSKTGKFRLHITALPILAQHARYKIWVKCEFLSYFLLLS
jgi:hypothetical protein